MLSTQNCQSIGLLFIQKNPSNLSALLFVMAQILHGLDLHCKLNKSGTVFYKFALPYQPFCTHNKYSSHHPCENDDHTVTFQQDVLNTDVLLCVCKCEFDTYALLVVLLVVIQYVWFYCYYSLFSVFVIYLVTLSCQLPSIQGYSSIGLQPCLHSPDRCIFLVYSMTLALILHLLCSPVSH